MGSDRPKHNSMSLEEATASNMREVAAMVEVLDRKGGIIELGDRVTKGATH